MRDVTRIRPETFETVRRTVVRDAGTATAGRTAAGPAGARLAFRALPVLGMAAIAIALAGCARARVTDVASTNPASGPAPIEILVDVGVAPAATGDEAQAKTARDVAAKLESDLVKELTEAHVTAEPFVSGTSHPGAAVLHVAISKADPGSWAERLAIGFGLGRAELQATADLESTDTAGAASLTSFSTAGNSGYKPGLILPVGVYAATREVSHLVIGGGIKLATGLNDGLDKPVEKTAAAVVSQLKSYYGSTGWYWPAESRA